MEFPSEKEVLFRLNDLIRSHPDTELAGAQRIHLRRAGAGSGQGLVPGKRALSDRRRQGPGAGRQLLQHGVVVGPDGDIVFRQVKAVPIQFFKDGLPAPEQKLWDSPWGKIGICICYDLSYTRVTDRLVALGAEAIIVPTMDVADWGRAQHELACPHRAGPRHRVWPADLPPRQFRHLAIGDRAGRVTGDGALSGRRRHARRHAGNARHRQAAAGPLARALRVGVTALLIVWLTGSAGPRHPISCLSILQTHEILAPLAASNPLSVPRV